MSVRACSTSASSEALLLLRNRPSAKRATSSGDLFAVGHAAFRLTYSRQACAFNAAGRLGVSHGFVQSEEAELPSINR